MSGILYYFAALMIAHKFNKKLNWTAPFTILLLSLTLYLFGLLNLLLEGAYIEYSIIIFSIIYVLYFALKKDKKIIDLIKSPASITIIAAAIFFSYLSVGRNINLENGLDSFTIWAIQVKNMYYYNTLYSTLFTNSPKIPGIMLWNYLACRSWISYAEGIMFLAQSMYTVTLLLPIYDCIENVEYQKQAFLIIFVLILLFPATFRADVYGSLYADVLLSELTFYGAISIYYLFKHGEKFDIINIVCVLFAVTFTKRIGITLASIILFSFAFCIEYLGQNDEIIVSAKKNILSLTVFTLTPVFFYWSWLVITSGLEQSLSLPMFLPILGSGGGLLIGLILKKIRKYLSYRKIIFLVLLLIVTAAQIGERIFFKDETSKQITISFLKNLFLTERCSYGQTIPLSAGAFAIVIIAIWYFIIHYYKTKVSSLFKTLAGSMFIGMIGYLIVLLATYSLILVKIFGHDTINLTSFNRYMIPWFLVLLGFTIILVLSTVGKKQWIVYPISLILILLSLNIGEFVEYLISKPQQTQFYAFEEANVELTSDDIVYFIDETDNETMMRAFNYSVFPARAFTTNPTLSYKEIIDKLGDYPSVSEVRYEISQCDYVYIQSIDDQFVSLYSELFTDPSEITTSAVYKVVDMDGTVMLEKIQ